MQQTINEIFKSFLLERKKDLAPKTFGCYEDAIGLMVHCFNGYGHLYLDEKQNQIFDKKFAQGVEFCDQFGSEVLTYSLFSEFIGYFLPKKVAVGLDSAKKICGACLNFYKWLVANKLIEDDTVSVSINELRQDFNYHWKEFNKHFNERGF